MDAITLLTQDHKKVDLLFLQLKQTQTLQEKRRIFDAIKQGLEIHTQIKESLVYPFFSEAEGFDHLIKTANEGHQKTKSLLQDASSLIDENELDHTLEKLMSVVQRYVKAEEETLFPKIKEVLKPQDLEQLGARLEEAKSSFYKRVENVT